MTIPDWHTDLITALKKGEQAIRIILIRAEGSTPRETGADMMIYPDHFTGTIGGGTLEYEAIIEARKLMAAPRSFYRTKRQYPLGPTLGQCCGGFVEVLFEHITPQDSEIWQGFKGAESLFHPNESSLPPTASPKDKDGIWARIASAQTPLYLYGAGHVGRAVMQVISGLPLTRLWIDTDRSRFPEHIPDDIEQVIAANPATIARHAPEGAIHLVMTYAHQLDLDICLAILEKNTFAHLGLIGSSTKKSRFDKALLNAGIDKGRVKKLVCPIGLDAIGGKDPARVALSIAGQISEWTRGTS